MLPSPRRASSLYRIDARSRRGGDGSMVGLLTAALGRANSSSVAVGAAAGFLLLSVAMSAVPETRLAAGSPADAELGLRGRIDDGADQPNMAAPALQPEAKRA